MPASTPAVVEQRVVEVAAAARGRTVVTGWAALRLQGAGFCDGLARDGRTPLPVTVAANGDRIRSATGVLVTRDTVPDDEVLLLHGVLVAGPERALFDEVRRLLPDTREAAVAASMVFAAQLTSLARMRRYCAERRWFRDVRRVLAALDLADEHLRSPQEARLMMIWEHDARWGRPVCNRRVFDLDGRFVATPDLVDVERGVVGEFAGADHRDLAQHERDIAREADLRAVGLEYVEVVGRDLRRPEVVVRRMDEAAARVDPSRWRWRVEPAPTPTLDEILDRRTRAE